jgi:hypothetical protein
MKDDRERFDGWRVVGGAFGLAALGWGVGFYGPPVFLYAMTDRFGLVLASAAVTLHFLIGAFVVANLPALHRRFGVPRVTIAGSALLALGVVGWALAREPWHLLAATLASGAGWVAMGAAAINAIVAPWFERDRPKALSTAYNGASVGGVLFGPLWVAGIDALGFPATAAAVGLAMVAAVACLSTRLFGLTPESVGQRPDGRVGAAGAAGRASAVPPLPGAALWRSWRLRTLAAGMALGLFAQIGLLAHLVGLLAPSLGAHGAGFAMALATAAALVGRTAFGWLMPQGADRRLVACASYGVQIAGVAVMAWSAGDAAAALVGVALFGFGIGNATSLPPLIAQAEFAPADVPRVVAAIVACGQATYAFAPVSFGVLRALCGDAGGAVLLATALVQALAIAAFLAARKGEEETA